MVERKELTGTEGCLKEGFHWLSDHYLLYSE